MLSPIRHLLSSCLQAPQIQFLAWQKPANNPLPRSSKQWGTNKHVSPASSWFVITPIEHCSFVTEPCQNFGMWGKNRRHSCLDSVAIWKLPEGSTSKLHWHPNVGTGQLHMGSPKVMPAFLNLCLATRRTAEAMPFVAALKKNLLFKVVGDSLLMGLRCLRTSKKCFRTCSGSVWL